MTLKCPQFNLRGSVFQNFPGGMFPKTPAIACYVCKYYYYYQFYPKKGYTKGLEPVHGPQQ